MIGVLALQGGFAAHQASLDRLGVAHKEVRLAKHLDDLDGLIIPGGESTTMLKLLNAFDLFEPLRAFGRTGKPILGTCAGAILMARKVTYKNQQSLDWIPASIDRNAYGAQQESFETNFDIPRWEIKDVHALFIRAPRFRELGDGVQVLTTYGDDITGVAYQNFTAVTYHPELTDDVRFHSAWLNRCVRRLEQAS